jgi:hypothetical protein
VDRMKADRPGFRLSPGMIGVIVLLLVSGILVYKVVDEGWFAPSPSLELNGEPALVFFNRHKGCQCAMTVYFAAKYQVEAWSENARQGVPVFVIDLDTQPNLGKEFHVIRAPTLMLVDRYGRTILKQDEVVSDIQPLDLPSFEIKIKEMLEGE